MIPYAERFVENDVLVLFEKIKQTVNQMENPDLGYDEKGEEIVLSCHILARALGKLFKLKVCDGMFSVCFEHSWLEMDGEHILDPYPVAILGGPILHVRVFAGPSTMIFERYSARKISRGSFGKRSFKRAVRVTMSALRKAMKRI